MKVELLRLAERCEKAEGADRVLDAEIACAIHGYTMHEDSDPSRGIFAFWDRGICHNCSSWGEWTASIDAALSLVPGGWTWTVYADGCAGVMPRHDDDDIADGDTWAATAALAICAASLRARAAMENTNGN